MYVSESKADVVAVCNILVVLDKEASNVIVM